MAGEVVAAAGERLPAGFQPHVVLEPRSERGSIVDAAARGGPFDVLLMPGETYDTFVLNLPEDLYVAQVKASGGDVRAAGLSASMANSQPFQIVLESQGGKIDGQVFSPEGSPWSGATVTLIPNPPRTGCRIIAKRTRMSTDASASAGFRRAATS